MSIHVYYYQICVYMSGLDMSTTRHVDTYHTHAHLVFACRALDHKDMHTTLHVEHWIIRTHIFVSGLYENKSLFSALQVYAK